MKQIRSITLLLGVEVLSGCPGWLPVDEEPEDEAGSTAESGDAGTTGTTGGAETEDLLDEGSDGGPDVGGGAGCASQEDCPDGFWILELESESDCVAAMDIGWMSRRIHPGEPVQCAYEWVGPGAYPVGPPDLGKMVTPSYVERDCLVRAQGGETQGLQPYRDASLEDFDRAAGIEGLDGIQGVGNVVVFVVDTAPEETDDGASQHGPAVARTIARIANAALLADTDSIEYGETESALGRGYGPRVATLPGLILDNNGVRQQEVGGHYGRVSTVLEQLHRILAWVRTDGVGSRVIVNMSFGWWGDPSDPSESVELVLEALSEEGVIMIAASGNSLPGEDRTGPIWPAAFARSQPIACTGELLLVPVTPLTNDGDELRISSPNSNGPLAAVGTNGVAVSGTAHYGPHTGSSVAASIVSGVAARLWSLYPSREACEIVEMLWEGGVGQEQSGADIDVGFAKPSQSFVRACSVLQAACVQWPPYGYCMDLPCPMLEDASAQSILSEILPAFEDVSMLDATPIAPVCFPPDLEPRVEPWVIPQPEDILCHMCGVHQRVLYLKDYDVPPGPPSGTLRVVGWDSASREELLVAYESELNGQPVQLNLSAFNNLNLTEVYVEATSDDGISYGSFVTVIP